MQIYLSCMGKFLRGRFVLGEIPFAYRGQPFSGHLLGMKGCPRESEISFGLSVFVLQERAKYFGGLAMDAKVSVHFVYTAQG